MGPVAFRRAGPPAILDASGWWAGARSELVPPYFEKGDGPADHLRAWNRRCSATGRGGICVADKHPRLHDHAPSALNDAGFHEAPLVSPERRRTQRTASAKKTHYRPSRASTSFCSRNSSCSQPIIPQRSQQFSDTRQLLHSLHRLGFLHLFKLGDPFLRFVVERGFASRAADPV